MPSSCFLCGKLGGRQELPGSLAQGACDPGCAAARGGLQLPAASCQQRGERQVGTHQPPLLCVSPEPLFALFPQAEAERDVLAVGTGARLSGPSSPIPWGGGQGEEVELSCVKAKDRLHLTGPVVPAKMLAACAKRLGEALASAL